MKIACPKCGANTQYIPEENKCYCEYCGSLISPEELRKEDNKKLQNVNINENIEYNDYTCSSCGAKLISAESMVITDCIYCGSKQFIKEKFKSGFMPDKIIPFKIKKEECIKIYKEYIQNTPEIPFNKIQKLKIQEIKGVYVPFYKYKYENVVDIQGKFEIKDLQYYGGQERKYNYMNLKQGIEMEIPQCASSKMKSRILNKLEKYDFTNSEKFHPAYLMGFFAEVPDKDKEKETENAEIRCMQETNNFIRRSGYRLVNGSFEGDVKKLDYELIMLPIWFLTCECDGKTYKFIMNGQTGKFISLIKINKGRTPKDDLIMRFIGLALVSWLIYLGLSSIASFVFGDAVKAFVGVFSIILCIAGVPFLIKLYNKEKQEQENAEKFWDNNPDALVPYSWNCNILDRKIYLENKFSNEEEYKQKCKYNVEKGIKYIISREGQAARQINLFKDNA